MLRLLYSSVLISIAFAQLQCIPGDDIGPPLGDMCPGDNVLTTNGNGEQSCCPRTSVFEPTVPAGAPAATSIATDAAGSTVIVTVAPSAATTVSGGVTSGRTTASSACADKKNPRTGVSDCPSLAYLCNDANYIAVMTEQCPKTCGRCGSSSTGSTGSNGTCVDLTNPRTGVSDCPSLANLCNDSNYYSIMTTQCPKTCGRCGSTGSTTAGTGTSATTTASSGTCADKVNPATGVSECPARRSLCTNSAYLTLMREQCPRTCGFC